MLLDNVLVMGCRGLEFEVLRYMLSYSIDLIYLLLGGDPGWIVNERRDF